MKEKISNSLLAAYMNHLKKGTIQQLLPARKEIPLPMSESRQEGGLDIGQKNDENREILGLQGRGALLPGSHFRNVPKNSRFGVPCIVVLHNEGVVP